MDTYVHYMREANYVAMQIAVDTIKLAEVPGIRTKVKVRKKLAK